MDKLELIKRHLADYSANRWDRYKDDLAAGIVYEEVGTGVTAKGIDEYLPAVQRWKKAFPDLAAKVLNGFASGDNVFVEIEWSGTHSGPFDGPFGTIAATNKRGSIRAALVMRVANDKIVENHHYFDVLTALKQMGLSLPMAAPKAAAKPVATQPPRH